MRNVTIQDVRRRVKNISCSTDEKSSFVESVNKSIHQLKRVSEAKRLIETGVNSNQNVPFYIYMELFDVVAHYGTARDIDSVGTYIANEAVTKSRDAKQTQTLIKRRLTSMKNKASNALDKVQDKLKAKTKPQKPAVNNAATATSKTKTTMSPKKEEAIINIYEKMLEAANVINHCDRVIENYNRVSKRFNLELLFQENTRVNGVEDTVLELCKFIDTYSMPDTVKFNTVIESAWYGFESNKIDYKKSDILETAIDYFLFKENGLESCKTILESTVFYDKESDLGDKQILFEEDPEEDEESTNESYDINKALMDYCTRKPLSEEIKMPTRHTEDEKDQFNKMFEKFKKDDLKEGENHNIVVTKFKGLLNKLYKRDVTGVLDGTPKLLTWVRNFLILGIGLTSPVGPLIAVVGILVDHIIDMHMEKSQLEKMVKCFDNEIKATKTKLESIKNDDEKKNLEQYLKSLKDARKKINEAYENTLTDAELDAKFDAESDDDFDFDSDDDSDFNFDDEDFDFDDDDFDFNDDDFLEAKAIKYTGRILNEFMRTVDTYGVLTEADMFDIASVLTGDDITNIATMVAEYPEELYKDQLLSAIDSAIRYDRNNPCETLKENTNRHYHMYSLEQAKSILNNSTPKVKPDTIQEAIRYFEPLNTYYEAIVFTANTLQSRYDNTIMEASITNSLKVASMKLKKAMQKMSDKDKKISQSIDMGANNLTKGVERALTTDNRESIIKGSIIPSASKMIKLGIVNAGLVAIGQPILAIIATLGYIGVNKKFKHKERQMIIDELEIELKMCNKYIDIAESKNDMKALKQLMQTQRQLERQLQRVKYKMAVDYGDVPKSTSMVQDNLH